MTPSPRSFILNDYYRNRCVYTVIRCNSSFQRTYYSRRTFPLSSSRTRDNSYRNRNNYWLQRTNYYPLRTASPFARRTSFTNFSFSCSRSSNTRSASFSRPYHSNTLPSHTRDWLSPYRNCDSRSLTAVCNCKINTSLLLSS